MRTSRIPYDLTLEFRRTCRAVVRRRRVAWSILLIATLLLCISLGCLAGALNSLPLSALAGLLILAGIKSAHYLLIHH